MCIYRTAPGQARLRRKALAGPAMLVMLAPMMVLRLSQLPQGPGQGNWTRGNPEDHNLTEAVLWQAGRQLQMATPVKECFAVAAGGKLLYEIDYRAAAGKPATLIESDSAGKTITALVIGVLVTKFKLGKLPTLARPGTKLPARRGSSHAAARDRPGLHARVARGPTRG